MGCHARHSDEQAINRAEYIQPNLLLSSLLCNIVMWITCCVLSGAYYNKVTSGVLGLLALGFTPVPNGGFSKSLRVSVSGA